jgi:hypothetical protein
MGDFPRLLLVCGLPATGKTTFGDWLRAVHGYRHLDLETRDCLAVNGLPAFWPERIWNLDATGLTQFFAYLRTLDTGTALTWAFHTDLIPLVADLVRHGCVPWWFEGDRLALRQAHWSRQRVFTDGVVHLGEPDMLHYDAYVASLVCQWGAIAPIFGDHILHTVAPDGARLPYDAIYQRILHTTPTSTDQPGGRAP